MNKLERACAQAAANARKPYSDEIKRLTAQLEEQRSYMGEKIDNREVAILELMGSLRDLSGQIIEGSHAPNRAQLLRALSAIEKANKFVPWTCKVGDVDRLRKKVME